MALYRGLMETYKPTGLQTYRPTVLKTYRPTDLNTYRPYSLMTLHKLQGWASPGVHPQWVPLHSA